MRSTIPMRPRRSSSTATRPVPPTLEHQKYMMGEVAKLVDPSDAGARLATYERTVKALLDQKIIAAAPTGAYTTAITDAL